MCFTDLSSKLRGITLRACNVPIRNSRLSRIPDLERGRNSFDFLEKTKLPKVFDLSSHLTNSRGIPIWETLADHFGNPLSREKGMRLVAERTDRLPLRDTWAIRSD
jgi:hypothetical protein